MNVKPREPIAERFEPPVAGIDLEQSLNYVSGPPVEWFYESFTFPKTFYRHGSRPELEAFLSRLCLPEGTTAKAAQELANSVYHAVHHYSLLGEDGKTDRGLSEEGLLRFGKGWCNEQARVLAVLAQIHGFPSRLVFAGMPNRQGHVLTELWIDGRWALIDQTAAYLFRDGEGNLLNVSDIKEGNTGDASALYLDILLAERAKAQDVAHWDRFVPYGLEEDPFLLFHHVGYCNYFIH